MVYIYIYVYIYNILYIYYFIFTSSIHIYFRFCVSCTIAKARTTPARASLTAMMAVALKNNAGIEWYGYVRLPEGSGGYMR